jgi:phosphatidylinositol glycan class S
MLITGQEYPLWEHANTSFPLEPYVQAPEIGLMTSGIPSGSLVIPVHPSQINDRFLRGKSG